MPTGGVNLENIQAFKQAGGVAFGLGKALVDTVQKVNDKYLQQLIKKPAISFVLFIHKSFVYED